MGAAGNALRVLEAPPKACEPLGDLRFRALLSDEEWSELPQAVRTRFSKRMAPGEMTVYAGEVTEIRMSFAGAVLAFLAKLIGEPFPSDVREGAASTVTVTEDARSGGQNWTRLYARRRARPQIIHSTKLFAGPTGLEERVGGGIGMALDVGVEDHALVFRSRRYFLRLGRLRIPLPRILTPGALTVTHTELGGGWFTFTLDVTHPRLGLLIRQAAKFREVTP
jgi:Domain of unknown function (DUF4166)